ncbi:MAG: helix-turn-helix transcriptional regulator [Gammaproteobacteria bacterium]|nr:helix-turn-helix transcriptional regulator [Gammaproteobacteria bacterium]
MSKQINQQLAHFGKRLAALRKAAGYTQQQLADEIGATRRQIAYYEAESQHPPANLLVDLARALNTSTDELLGLKAAKKIRPPDNRLQRRMQQIEKMGAKEKRQIIQLLDTFIEREQLKQQISGQKGRYPICAR